MHLVYKKYLECGLIIALDHINKCKIKTYDLRVNHNGYYRIHRSYFGNILLEIDFRDDFSLVFVYDGKKMVAEHDSNSVWFTVKEE